MQGPAQAPSALGKLRRGSLAEVAKLLPSHSPEQTRLLRAPFQRGSRPPEFSCAEAQLEWTPCQALLCATPLSAPQRCLAQCRARSTSRGAWEQAAQIGARVRLPCTKNTSTLNVYRSKHCITRLQPSTEATLPGAACCSSACPGLRSSLTRAALSLAPAGQGNCPPQGLCEISFVRLPCTHGGHWLAPCSGMAGRPNETATQSR